jgi:7-carboxy-7-deazaguanine synthase
VEKLKRYKVKEIYYTLQGEGAQAGRPAVFCRFTGCNLWSGREEDRSSAVCQFCDTDFVGTDGLNGGRYTAVELARKVRSLWPDAPGGKPYVVCTGGEPLLQLDEPLVTAFHEEGIEVAIETNGTLLPPPGIDWICMSPKAGSEWALRSGHELKLVFPQPGAEPRLFTSWNFQHFFLQPMDGPLRDLNTRLAIEYCLQHPQWRLSVQTHKLLGIP